MTNKTDVTNVQALADASEPESGVSETSDSGKMKFVEPELSPPVPVLEATTFFQNTTSGTTN